MANAPSGLTATAGNQQVALIWTPDPAAIGYNVKSSTTPGGPYNFVAADVSAAHYNVTGLANGAPYYFVVSTVNPLGESANSSQVAATPSLPPSPVLNVGQTNANVVLTWQPAGGRLQTTTAMVGTNGWNDVSNGQPVSVHVLGNSNAFFRVVVP